MDSSANDVASPIHQQRFYYGKNDDGARQKHCKNIKIRSSVPLSNLACGLRRYGRSRKYQAHAL
jgi:hypothetical protein